MLRMNIVTARNQGTMNVVIAGLVSLCIVGGVAAPDVGGQDRTDQLLEKAEVQLRAIYETGSFGGGNAKSFRGTWDADGTGYTTAEPGPESDRPVRVHYDAATGERTVSEDGRRDGQHPDRRSGRNRMSPDGHLVLSFEGGNLHVRGAEGGKSIPLTANSNGDSSSNGSRNAILF